MFVLQLFFVNIQILQLFVPFLSLFCAGTCHRRKVNKSILLQGESLHNEIWAYACELMHVMKLDIIYLKQAGMALPIKIEIVKCKLWHWDKQ